MVTAPTKRSEASFSVTIPTELYEQIEAKAAYLAVRVDQVVEVFLRRGLAVQDEKSTAIATLANQIVESQDCAQREVLGNDLGELIFRH